MPLEFSHRRFDDDDDHGIKRFPRAGVPPVEHVAPVEDVEVRGHIIDSLISAQDPRLHLGQWRGVPHQANHIGQRGTIPARR